MNSFIAFYSIKKCVILINSVDEASDSNELPRALKLIIERKATKNDNAKGYLLEIPNYPSLCQFLREKSRTTFDQRPNEELLRPFIINQLGPNAAKDSKVRMRIRDEFREIHRSYLRTFMHDPHGIHKTNKNRSQPLLPTKKSPWSIRFNFTSLRHSCFWMVLFPLIMYKTITMHDL